MTLSLQELISEAQRAIEAVATAGEELAGGTKDLASAQTANKMAEANGLGQVLSAFKLA